MLYSSDIQMSFWHIFLIYDNIDASTEDGFRRGNKRQRELLIWSTETQAERADIGMETKDKYFIDLKCTGNNHMPSLRKRTTYKRQW